MAEAEGEQATVAEERQTIYNADAMHDKLEEISWVAEQPWVESQVITHAAPTEVDNVDDDLARELAFYNQVCSTRLIPATPVYSVMAHHFVGA